MGIRKRLELAHKPCVVTYLDPTNFINQINSKISS